jgi:hypothetical protein
MGVGLKEKKGCAAVTKSELIDEISSHYPSVRRKDIEGMVNAIFDTMTQTLARNDRIEKSLEKELIIPKVLTSGGGNREHGGGADHRR